MDQLFSLVKEKLNDYGYDIYQTYKTPNKNEWCIMTEDMMVFTNEDDKSVTFSFECTLLPEKVAENMMVLNEVEEIKIVYVSESYFLDSEKKMYVVGEEARKLAREQIIKDQMKEVVKDQIYSHILQTQKCHEC